MVDRLVRSPKAATKEHALESERRRGARERYRGNVPLPETYDLQYVTHNSAPM